MQSFSAAITDIYGEQSTFSLSVDERRQQGSLKWPAEVSNLIKMRVSNTGDQILCWVKWPSFNLRCVISSSQTGGNAFIHIVLAGTKHSFIVAELDHKAFLGFVKALNLPVEAFDEVTDDNIQDRPQTEDFLKGSELELTHVSLFAAKHFASEVEIKFSKINVNGKNIDVSRPRPIPSNQGIHIPLELYETGENILIVWEFDIGYVPEPTTVLIGVFRNGSLTNRTELKRLNVDAFETYSDSSGVKV